MRYNKVQLPSTSFDDTCSVSSRIRSVEYHVKKSTTSDASSAGKENDDDLTAAWFPAGVELAAVECHGMVNASSIAAVSPVESRSKRPERRGACHPVERGQKILQSRRILQPCPCLSPSHKLSIPPQTSHGIWIRLKKRVQGTESLAGNVTTENFGGSEMSSSCLTPVVASHMGGIAGVKGRSMMQSCMTGFAFCLLLPVLGWLQGITQVPSLWTLLCSRLGSYGNSA